MTFEGNAYFPSGKHTTYGNIQKMYANILIYKYIYMHIKCTYNQAT